MKNTKKVANKKGTPGHAAWKAKLVAAWAKRRAEGKKPAPKVEKPQTAQPALRPATAAA